MQNMPQNGQKRQKVQKPKKCTNENWPIFIPCDVDDHFWWSKQAKNTQKQPYLVGLSENRWKNTKNAISQKGLAKRFWKLVKFMSYMCTLRIKSKQTSYRKVRLDVVWGKCALDFKHLIISARCCQIWRQFYVTFNLANSNEPLKLIWLPLNWTKGAKLSDFYCCD